jgi:hypothetical protein
MALQNRVTPLGELIAHPARGLVYGNRGCLHDEHGRIRRHHATRRWIGCRLRFKGWRRGRLLQPGKFTELFFLDEATAFAAGHRPCAECRHDDYRRFVAVWRRLHPGGTGADAMDAQLHEERVDPVTRKQRRHETELDELPNGAFALWEDAPWLVLDDRLLRWSSAGYTERLRRPVGVRVPTLTPPSLVAVLRTGWQPLVPLFHSSARDDQSSRPSSSSAPRSSSASLYTRNAPAESSSSAP